MWQRNRAVESLDLGRWRRSDRHSGGVVDSPKATLTPKNNPDLALSPWASAANNQPSSDQQPQPQLHPQHEDAPQANSEATPTSPNCKTIAFILLFRSTWKTTGVDEEDNDAAEESTGDTSRDSSLEDLTRINSA